MPLLPLEPYAYPENLFQAPHLADDDAPARWWVLQTRPRMEKSLARRLLRSRISFFLPLYSRRWQTQGRWLNSHVPLFTGYLFLKGSSEARLAALQTNLVAMCLHVVDQEQLFADLSRVHDLMASGVPLAPEDRLRVGDWVEISSGPLTGLQGRILRRGSKLRFCVEVQMLQRGVSVDIERWMLRPLPVSQTGGELLNKTGT
jgi:transcription antitermination factor NusG